jgi:hypothetical protein
MLLSPTPHITGIYSYYPFDTANAMMVVAQAIEDG